MYWQIRIWIFVYLIILSGSINAQDCEPPLNAWPIVKANWTNCPVLSDGVCDLY